jgi:hypothetical protein
VGVDIERALKLAQRFTVQAVPTLMGMNRTPDLEATDECG